MNNTFDKIKEEINFLRNRDLAQSFPKHARQSLWHAIKVTHAAEQLKAGYLQAYTSHRYWADGIRRKESDPLYEESFWMYGWSMTRKREYAENWAQVVLEFDHEKIAQQFKIMPIAWNNLFNHNKTFQKKEFEEFVIAHKEPRSINDFKADEKARSEIIDSLYDSMAHVNAEQKEEIKQKIALLEKNDKSWLHDWQAPRGKTLDLKKCLKGVYLNQFSFDMAQDSTNREYCENVKTIMTHPLYKGLYQDNHDRLRVKKIKP